MMDGTSVLQILVWMSAGISALMLLGTVYNLRTAPRLVETPRVINPVKVSLLIPVRNEAKNLQVLLPMLSALDYPDLEILLLDDESSDGTPALLANTGGPVKVLNGKPLPEGWLGKNWACAQLAEAAQGEILIFCDADVRVGPKSVLATVSMLQKKSWDALTGLPHQILGTWAEKAVLPILLFQPLLGFLPIGLIPKLPYPILSLGCGQWFAFTRQAYNRLGGHGAVRNIIVEDMTLGRLVKKHGMVLGAVFTQRLLSVRMYTDFHSVWQGFSKNLNFLTGTGFIRPPVIMTVFLLVNAAPWILPFTNTSFSFLPLSLWLSARWLTAMEFREPGWGWLWSPVGILLIPILSIRSWWGFRRGTLQWKGRVLKAAFADAGRSA